MHSLSSVSSVKTAKAEKRRQEQLKKEGSVISGDEETKKLSPAEHRSLEAEKRAAWRQARLEIILFFKTVCMKTFNDLWGYLFYPMILRQCKGI